MLVLALACAARVRGPNGACCEHECARRDRTDVRYPRPMDVERAPLRLHRERVEPGWVDYNGHMNVAYYLLAFDHATDAFLDHIGMDAGHRESTGGTIFVLEAHVTYERELAAGDPLEFTTQVLDVDERRVHLFHAMYHGGRGELAATNELLALHVDLATRRAAPFADGVAERLDDLASAHAPLGRPAQAGRAIGLRAGRPGG